MPLDSSAAFGASLEDSVDNSSTLSPLTDADADQTERTAARTTSVSNSPSGAQVATIAGANTYYTRDDQGNLIGERLSTGTGTS